MIDDSGYRTVMRNLAAGVSIVTAVVDGVPYGMTATSFTSVSLDPMLVQVSLEKSSRTHQAVRDMTRFAVNILAADQAEVAQRFAESGNDSYDQVDFSMSPTGLPIIDGAIGTLECEVIDELDGGDHTIFVGKVTDGSYDEQSSPLLYFRGKYRTLQEEDNQ
ncbi:MAG: flavin reductase family protein [Actinomycetota bacterium]|nr:flavin reductase family protein [Actinomycetota bacterium]